MFLCFRRFWSSPGKLRVLLPKTLFCLLKDFIQRPHLRQIRFEHLPVDMRDVGQGDRRNIASTWGFVSGGRSGTMGHETSADDRRLEEGRNSYTASVGAAHRQ
jgi:hypothetical protein